MKNGHLYTCDACGVQARGIVPSHRVEVWPPLRWLWAFGSSFLDCGPHACSRVCWERYRTELWAAGCKIYIDTSHRYWDQECPPPNECREVTGHERPLQLRLEHMMPRARLSPLRPGKDGSAENGKEHPAEKREKDDRWPRPHDEAGHTRSLEDAEKSDDCGCVLEADEKHGRDSSTRRRPPSKRVIFFAQQGHDGPVKIGFSKRVAERMFELGSAAGKTLRLLGTMPGDKKDKLKIIEQFKDWQLGGEWFAPADEVLEFIRANGVETCRT